MLLQVGREVARLAVDVGVGERRAQAGERRPIAEAAQRPARTRRRAMNRRGRRSRAERPAGSSSSQILSIAFSVDRRSTPTARTRQGHLPPTDSASQGPRLLEQMSRPVSWTQINTRSNKRNRHFGGGASRRMSAQLCQVVLDRTPRIRAIHALDAIPVRADLAQIELKGEGEILAEARRFLDPQIFTLGRGLERHPESPQVVAEGDEPTVLPDLDEPLILGWQLRAQSRRRRSWRGRRRAGRGSPRAAPPILLPK